MGKRFKILNGALNLLRTDDEGANPDAPTGTPLKLYQDWKKGARNIKYDTTNWGKPGELIDVSINPFSLPVGANSLATVPMSKRVADATVIAAVRNKAGITNPAPTTSDRLLDFTPAKCTASVPNAQLNNPTAESKLTGIKYDKKGRASYTFPFGATTEADREGAARATIRAAITAESNIAVSFSSEKI